MSKNKLRTVLKLSAPISALLCAILCAVAFKYGFDKDIGYFANSPFAYVFYASLILTVTLSILAAIKHVPSGERDENRDRRAMAIVMACAFAFYLISFLLSSKPAYLSYPMYALIILGAFTSIAHFIIIAFLGRCGSSLKILTGLGAVFTPILIATASYFDHTQTLNSPYKLLFEFGCAAFALYYITELRVYTPAPRKKMIVAISGICTALTLCAGVAKMFEITFNSAPTPLNIASAILFAAMASCSASELLLS